MSRRTDMELMFAPGTSFSATMLFVASAAIAGIVLMQIAGRPWMLFVSKSKRALKLVIPSCRIRLTAASELSFMLVLCLSHDLKEAAAAGGMVMTFSCLDWILQND